MKSTNKIFNQRGASAIMFALFFITVISLISVGFATLVRRDQRSTLDKTLSAQAQLAAESGINAAKQYFDLKGVGLESSNPGLEKTSCGPAGDLTYPVFTEGVSITCLVWDATPTQAAKELNPYEGWSFTNSASTGRDSITWETTGGGGTYGGASGLRANLPQIQAGNLPILKVATISKADIYNTGQPKIEVFYLVPGDVNPAASTINIGDGATNTNTNGSAAAFNVNCTNTGVCQAILSGYPNPAAGERMYYLQLIGEKPAAVTYMSLDGGGGALELRNIQAEVDVNVVAQDQSKRIIGYVPLESKTVSWQPFYAALSDSLCKDIKVDGANNRSASLSGVCPN